ncbi:MAG: glycosyltransferase family 4 protein [bacterium]|nr:glycosyltransferase family 4 protein [bacterium]
MKISYICEDSQIPLMGVKGASIHIREVINALIKLNHEVFAITTNKGAKNHENGQYTIHEVSPFTSKKLGSDLRMTFTSSKLYKKARILFNNAKPDLIYERYELYGSAGMKLAQKFNIPFILEVNAALLWGPKRRLNFRPLARYVENNIFRSAGAIIITTDNLRDYVIRKGVDKSKVFEVPDGVDSEKFNPEISGSPIRKKYKLEKKQIVGFVGSLSKRQGLSLFLDAAEKCKQQIPDIHFLIVGEGFEEHKLKNFVKNNKLENIVTFTGAVSHNDIPAYIAAMDITVLPNMSIYSSPVKIFEYMAMAKPTIAPAQGQMNRFFENEKEILLIKPGDQEQLANNITKLFSDPALRKRLGSNARYKVSNSYTWEHNAKRILEIYRTIHSSDSHI